MNDADRQAAAFSQRIAEEQRFIESITPLDRETRIAGWFVMAFVAVVPLVVLGVIVESARNTDGVHAAIGAIAFAFVTIVAGRVIRSSWRSLRK